MEDDYFVTLPPRAVEPAEPVDEVSIEQLDLSGLHEPLQVPGWLRALAVLGRVLLVLGVLVLAALPVLGLWALFRFLDSLPF